MANPALTVFLVAFVAGPLLAALLLRLPSRVPVLLAFSGGVFLTMGAALVLQGRSTLGSMFALWLGWVLAVVMMAHAFRRRMPSAFSRRWTAVGALLASALPWFGLAVAQMMV
jgi:hypothetical protein